MHDLKRGRGVFKHGKRMDSEAIVPSIIVIVNSSVIHPHSAIITLHLEHYWPTDAWVWCWRIVQQIPWWQGVGLLFFSRSRWQCIKDWSVWRAKKKQLKTSYSEFKECPIRTQLHKKIYFNNWGNNWWLDTTVTKGTCREVFHTSLEYGSFFEQRSVSL